MNSFRLIFSRCVAIAIAIFSTQARAADGDAATVSSLARPEIANVPSQAPKIDAGELPKNSVRVEIFEFPNNGEAHADAATFGNDSDKPSASAKVKDTKGGLEESWANMPPQKTDEYIEPAFAFAAVTEKYNTHGIRIDRSRPFLVRAAAVIALPEGGHQLLLRSLGGARVSIDGEIVAKTDLLKQHGGDAEAVPDQLEKQLVKTTRLLPAGHREAIATIHSDGKPHVFVLEAFVGGKGIRPEIGELSVSIASDGKNFALLAPDTSAKARVAFIDSAWIKFAAAQNTRIENLNAARRKNFDEEKYWQFRHDLARKLAKPSPEIPKSENGKNPIDAFIAAKLEAAKIALAPLTDDAAFLRRVTLDTIGLVPTAEEVRAFLADKSPDKRARVIDRLLADTRWADRWVGYWQDVLAENPSMLKATLNNTGPFRWWIYESLRDNKPMDRFVTELVSLDGSALYGGPAGFAIASQNDLPMAAKAQIVASAFLAMEMKCARCHDAPYHNFEQGDLFHFAALLGRESIKVPGSSLTQGLSPNSHVKVSLKPGQIIEPKWPFADEMKSDPLPNVLRKKDDTRELLAAVITDPRNERFPRVMVNRLWKELIGVGLVEPVEDWETAVPSHPELLDWLAREFITHDYDLKHVARLILNSQTYQRVATPACNVAAKRDERLFQSPARRRMTAEQLVDSLFFITGKNFDAGLLTMDPEDRQAAGDHTNLGSPQRAWQFAPLSNERDRISLAKPRAQLIADVLSAFGWRESRAEPRSTRDHDANILQPAILANGLLGTRFVRLTDDSAFTALALRDQPASELVRQIFLRVFSHEPSEREMEKFTELLLPGYDTRLTGAAPAPPAQRSTRALSWANHLNPDAPKYALEIDREVKAGDPPTAQLETDWRERMEDMLWAMLVSPEFIYIP